MSKTDRKKKLNAKKRAVAEAARRGDILAVTPKREPSGRRAKPRGGWNQNEPTKEAKARRAALLPKGNGCMDDWVDVAESTGRIDAWCAEALRRYRGYLRAFARKAGVPGVAVLSDVRGLPTEAEGEEEEFQRIKDMLAKAEQALKLASRRDSDTLEQCIRSQAMPTDGQLERIENAAKPLAEAMGV